MGSVTITEQKIVSLAQSGPVPKDSQGEQPPQPPPLTVSLLLSSSEVTKLSIFKLRKFNFLEFFLIRGFSVCIIQVN